MPEGRAADAAIIGGGAIGGAIALELARRGLSVTLIESGRVGRGASWAAAGVLAPEWSGHDPPALTALARAGLDLWPGWAAEVEARSGVGLNFRREGLLNLWVDPDAPGLPPDLALEPPEADSHAGDWLDAKAVRDLEPTLTGPVLGGFFSRDDAQVDNPRLAPALVRAARDLGARLRLGTPAVGLLRSGGRCVGVRLADGEEVPSGATVLAAGAWSGPLAEAAGIALPIEPWRGQMLAFDALALDRPPRHVVFCGELVLIPRPHGPLVVGTTLERVGFDSRVTLGGLAQILARVSRVAPRLAGLPLIRTWAGLRPGTPDGLPHIGPVPGWDGLFAATGHGRKGLILAPITASLIARLVVDGEPDPLLAACDPGRVVPR